jgi:EAL domain-containing protein (putative c-di-GMP-specific phosphodiesterase class I)
MLLIFEACEEAGLAESIGLKKFHVRQKLADATNKFRRHGRTAISQNLEAAQVVRLSLEHLRQQVQHRGHEHGVSYAFVLDQLTETLRAELRKCDLAHAESRCCEHGGKISNVKNRCRM